MWRCSINLPERVRIGIFNRSYYEEMLVVRAHPEILARQKLPPHLVTKNIWRERFEDVVAYERYLARNGVLILKFFLNVSKDEQRERLESRRVEEHKQWKFNVGDLEERKLWGDYMAAYEAALSKTSTEHAPWYIVPADRKWYRNWAILRVLLGAMEELDPQFPPEEDGLAHLEIV